MAYVKGGARTFSSTPIPSKRVMVVGGTGEGKSSLINLFMNETTTIRPAVSDGARGCTFKCTNYEAQWSDCNYLLADTVGLNEPEGGTVPHKDAVKSLLHFAKQHSQGFHLIVFVMKKGRVTKTFKDTYELFRQILYREQIPSILYLSWCELDGNMGDWYEKHKEEFDNSFVFTQVVCGTALVHSDEGFERKFAPKREETRIRMRNAIRDCALAVPVRINNNINVFKRLVNFFFGLAGGETFFKSETRQEIEKKLRDMGYDQATIKDIASVFL